ncbi:hypothetical protein D3C77_361700 [compost metagenome]
MQQAPGCVQVVNRHTRQQQDRQGQPQALGDPATPVQHADADAQQKLVDDVVAVEVIEQPGPGQYFADQQQGRRNQQHPVLLAHQEYQGEQQVEEHFIVQGPADVERRVLTITAGVLGRDEQQRQHEMLKVDGLVRHPLARGEQQQPHQRGVEPVGRHDAQRPVEQKALGRNGLVAGREVNDHAADDKEDVHPHGTAVGEELADGATGVEVEEDLHEVVTHHHPGGERPQGLKRIQHPDTCL